MILHKLFISVTLYAGSYKLILYASVYILDRISFIGMILTAFS